MLSYFSYQDALGAKRFLSGKIPHMEQTIQEITFEDFLKIDIRVGEITSSERVKGSKKMIKLMVDMGDMGERQVLTGLGESLDPEEFLNKKVCFVTNVKPRKMMGLESQAVIMGTDEEHPKLLLAPDGAEPGTRIY
jgi:methionine--tRNA ligase beta chain